MTERETLLAEIAERQARLAELDAEPEPDWQAWKPLVREIISMYHTTRLADADVAAHILGKPSVRALIAAFAKAPPMGSVMGEAEIEELTKGELPYTAARIKWAVKRTLSRVQPRWPSEEGKVKLVIAIINAYHTTRLADTPFALQHILSKAFVKDAFARLYQTGQQP